MNQPVRPRLQRVGPEILSKMLREHLTDKEWKELSYKVCTRDYNKEVEKRKLALWAIKNSGPSL